MRAKILTLRSSIAALTSRRGYGGGHRCSPHMNELPVPCGSWEAMYTAKQQCYNMILVGGIIWHIFSLGMLIWTDSIYLNFSPPQNPGPPSDMIEECDDSDT